MKKMLSEKRKIQIRKMFQMQRKGGCREIDSPLLEIKRRKSFLVLDL